MNTLRKLPECNKCQFYARSLYIVCAVHPQGCIEESCLDFRLDHSIQIELSWAPQGYSWYGGALIASPERLTESDRIQLLNTHPLFTRRCPRCDSVFEEAPRIHWDCSECGWKDDSVV